MEERLAKERELWAAIPKVPDLQCVWQLLLQSANPRANHIMRTMLPSVSAAFCHSHDEGVWDSAKILLDGVPAANEAVMSTLPMRMGSWVAVSSEVRTRSVLGVVDALHMISQRTPDVAHDVLRRLSRFVRVRKRVTPTERMLARICREAGARVKYNAFLRDMNLKVRADDERRIEGLAQDFPCLNGAQLT